MKKRLDIVLCELGLCESREQAQGFILSGSVWSGERRLEKPGMPWDPAQPLELRLRNTPFVSRAGEKLHHALERFQFDVQSRVCLDVGASTGGFTDCLLKRGAAHVFAVDVGYGQFDSKLRASPAITLIEKKNARFLTLPELTALSPKAKEISLVVADVSFISLQKIIEPLSHELAFCPHWIVLFKPQFEVGRKFVGKAGLVRDAKAIDNALNDFHVFMKARGFELKGGPESSPLTGKKSGNLEYLIQYELRQK